MALTINTNVASLNAQRNLGRSQGLLNQSLERLSTGLRINSAKDDAAGLAISERFTTQIRGLNQAVRNANDGISLAQTAEGALAELNNNLQRIRELAVQSANATNSASDRSALDQEVQQRLAEIDRIATQTAFNDQTLLDGTFGNAAFQVGANVGQTISVTLNSSMRTLSIGKTADYIGGGAFSAAQAVGQQGDAVDGSAIASGEVTIAVGSGDAQAVVASVAEDADAGLTAGSAYAKVKAINSSGISGVTATADTTAVFDFAAVDDAAYNLTINNQAIYTAQNFVASPLSGTDFVAAINANASATGVTASFDSTASTVTLSAADGRDISITELDGAAGTDVGLGAAVVAANNDTNLLLDVEGVGPFIAQGSIRLTAAEQLIIGGSAAEERIGFVENPYALGASALNTAGVTTVAEANTTITRVDAALQSVSGLRSQFGAIQNRFESTIANLQAVSENLSASRGRIQDADFAAETAALTKAQILQQAGVAVLSQANAQPQLALSLLQ